MISTISILGGRGRNGEPDAVDRIDLRMGDVVSIVGPTGSGKTTLINDIELRANANTPTGRKILFDGGFLPEEDRDRPMSNPVAHISQHTTFLSDLPVDQFLQTHARVRCSDSATRETAVQRTLEFANQLTGEPIAVKSRMTELSGGQTRALLIADATVICDSPIILLDEVENAGIHRNRALELLRQHRKIFVFVTHDPRIALLSDYRIVMKGGQIREVLHTDAVESRLAAVVGRLDDALAHLREQLRSGNRVTQVDLKGFA